MQKHIGKSGVDFPSTPLISRQVRLGERCGSQSAALRWLHEAAAWLHHLGWLEP